MSDFCIGFHRLTVNPPDGIYMRGYFRSRFSEGILDDIEILVAALSCEGTTALVITMDILGLYEDSYEILCDRLVKATGVPAENIYLHGTHTHTGPSFSNDAEDRGKSSEYFAYFQEQAVLAAKMALADMKPACMGHGIAMAPKLAFIRRFRMKDGSIRTNPGVGNPDIAEPIGEPDHRICVLKFEREDGKTVLMVSYGNHPDVISGHRMSADWPGFLRRSLEQIVPNCCCMSLTGAQGDVNHINVNVKPGEFSHIGPKGGEERYAYSRYMGYSLACAVLQILGSIQTREVSSLRCLLHDFQVPSNMPTPEDDMQEAHRIYDLYMQGRKHELPYTDMMLTTVVARAKRMVNLEHGPVAYDMTLTGLAIDDVVLVGIPGEPFTGIGLGLKDTQDWAMVVPTCNTGKSLGYFPMQDSYDEGGYEAGSSPFKAGVAELIIREGRRLMQDLK